MIGRVNKEVKRRSRVEEDKLMTATIEIERIVRIIEKSESKDV